VNAPAPPLATACTADGPWGALRWSYDPATSETRGGMTTYHYDASTQRLTSTTGTIAETFGYDLVGRLETDGRGTYGYTARGLRGASRR
jgi:hypothetical protein